MKTIKSLFLVTVVFLCSAANVNEKPGDFPAFFADCSVELLAREIPAGMSMGSPAKDDTDFTGHLRWAQQTPASNVVADLILKFHIMTELKSLQGKQHLASWYAKCCHRWSGFGVDFGSSAANSPLRITHYNWAKLNSTTKLQINGELTRRILLIFKSYYHQDMIRKLAEAMAGGSMADLFNQEKTGTHKDPKGINHGDIVKAAMKSLNNALKEEEAYKALNQVVSSEKGEVYIACVFSDPVALNGQILTGSKLFISGSYFGNNPGTAYIVLGSSTDNMRQFTLLPFDDRGWQACWHNDGIMARVPVINLGSRRVAATLVIRNSNGKQGQKQIVIGN